MNVSPRIENSDRGFTVSKSLGWTMATGLVAASFYMGMTLSSLGTDIRQIKDQNAEFRRDVQAEITELSRRTMMLERGDSADDARFDEIARILQRVDGRLVSIDERLRRQEQQQR